jgi:hypothetical protein
MLRCRIWGRVLGMPMSGRRHSHKGHWGKDKHLSLSYPLPASSSQFLLPELRYKKKLYIKFEWGQFMAWWLAIWEWGHGTKTDTIAHTLHQPFHFNIFDDSLQLCCRFHSIHWVMHICSKVADYHQKYQNWKAGVVCKHWCLFLYRDPIPRLQVTRSFNLLVLQTWKIRRLAIQRNSQVSEQWSVWGDMAD